MNNFHNPKKKNSQMSLWIVMFNIFPEKMVIVVIKADNIKFPINMMIY